MREIRLSLPLKPGDMRGLEVSDKVLLSGDIYTARDQAHKRMVDILCQGQDLAFDLKKTAIFYCGPSPAREGQICGAVGPTTSYRMDPYVEIMLKHGLRVMIGKGDRGVECVRLIKEYAGLYLTCVGGISAVLSRHIVSCETFLWPELGTEAVYHMVVKDLPCYVAIV